MKPEKPKYCSVCGREPTEARGLCNAHYRQWQAGAPYDAPLMRIQKGLLKQCTYEGCDRPHRSKGLCSTHYYRQWAGLPVQPRSTPVGEAHPNAKLTEDAVRQIRALRSQGASYNELAAKFGVSYDTARGVVTRRLWKHI